MTLPSAFSLNLTILRTVFAPMDKKATYCCRLQIVQKKHTARSAMNTVETILAQMGNLANLIMNT